MGFTPPAPPRVPRPRWAGRPAASLRGGFVPPLRRPLPSLQPLVGSWGLELEPARLLHLCRTGTISKPLEPHHIEEVLFHRPRLFCMSLRRHCMSSMWRANAVESRRGDTRDTEDRANFLDHDSVHKRRRNRLDGIGRHGSRARSERFQWIQWEEVDCLLLVSSESDSAALAPFQQDFRGLEARGVHQPVQKRSVQVLRGSLRGTVRRRLAGEDVPWGEPATKRYATRPHRRRSPSGQPALPRNEIGDRRVRRVAGPRSPRLGIGVTIVELGDAHPVPLRELVGAPGGHPVERGGEDAIESSRVVSSSCARQASSRWKRWSGSLKSRPAM